MAQITEAQLFEMLGRLFVELKVLMQENEALRQRLTERVFSSPLEEK